MENHHSSSEINYTIAHKEVAVMAVGRIATQHGLGLLVIDELQKMG